VAVGQGSGAEAARFCRKLGTDFTCLGDPTRAAYHAFGLIRDSWWNVTAAPFLEDPGLALRRIRRASLRGSLVRGSDVLQLGGTVLIDRAGVLRTLQRARRTDDHPPMAELLAALDRLVQERDPATP
jgi:hypothetical protein